MYSHTDPFHRRVLRFILADPSYPREDFFTSEEWAIVSAGLEKHPVQTIEELVNCVSQGAAWRHERTGTEAKEHLHRVYKCLVCHAGRDHECGGPECLINNFIMTLVAAAADDHFLAEILQEARNMQQHHALRNKVLFGKDEKRQATCN